MPASHVVKAMFCFTAPIWRSLTLLRWASLRTGSSQSSDLTLNSNNLTPSCHHFDLITLLLLKNQSSFTLLPHACLCYNICNSVTIFQVYRMIIPCFELMHRPWKRTSKNRCFVALSIYLLLTIIRVHERLQDLKPHHPSSQADRIILTSSNLLYLYKA